MNKSPVFICARLITSQLVRILREKYTDLFSDLIEVEIKKLHNINKEANADKLFF